MTNTTLYPLAEAARRAGMSPSLIRHLVARWIIRPAISAQGTGSAFRFDEDNLTQLAMYTRIRESSVTAPTRRRSSPSSIA